MDISPFERRKQGQKGTHITARKTCSTAASWRAEHSSFTRGAQWLCIQVCFQCDSSDACVTACQLAAVERVFLALHATISFFSQLRVS
jgi:hypothetical protein